MSRLCRQCNLAKSLEEFVKSEKCINGRTHICKKCHSKNSTERNRISRKNNPEVWKQKDRKADLKRYHNISLSKYEELFKKQDGVCAICASECNSGRNLAVDHCHKSGKIRGLLCANCNRGLGLFKDDKSLLGAAIEYLR